MSGLLLPRESVVDLSGVGQHGRVVHRSARCECETGQLRPGTAAELTGLLQRSGLTAACLASPHSYQEVADNVLAYIQKWVPEQRVGVLAGSSVHADMR